MVKNTDITPYGKDVKTIKRAILESQGRALRLASGQELSLYFGIGLYISTHSREGYWGTGAIEAISEQIRKEMPGLRGFSAENMKKMRTFSEFWSQFINRSTMATDLQRTVDGCVIEIDLFSLQKWSPSATVLTWSHYTELLALNDINKINYYIDICKKQSLSRNDLRNAIKSKEYERLSEETKNKLVTNEELKLPDLVPDPLLIKSEFNIEQLTEYALKQAILNNLDNFLTQLGNGFSYIGNEYKMKVGNNYNYIDLLLYNFKYKCFVVIELKVTELKKEHIGQIQVYMNYIDKNVKDVSDDKTIGIIICAKNNQFIIEYCSDERIFAREFKITS